MPMPCQERPCKQKLYQPTDEQKKLGSFLFLYIVVRLCKQAFNTIYYVQKRVETGISTLFAHHSFSRTFRLRKVRDFCVIPIVCRRQPYKKREKSACSSKLGQTTFSLFLRKVRDSNPRYNAMCTPHFECGSFDHSDNFPQLRVQRYNNFLN